LNVACGDNHTLALSKNNKIYSTGCGIKGQLGNGNEENCNDFVEIRTKRIIIQIAAAGDTSMALASNNVILYWGQMEFESNFSNLAESLGEVSHSFVKVNPNVPVEVPDDFGPVAKIACGPEYMVILTSSGNFWSWGKGLGLINDAYTNGVFNPIRHQFFDSMAVIDVFPGKKHIGVLLANGKCYFWGNNKYGQLSCPSSDQIKNPQLCNQLANMRVLKISCGKSHTAVIYDYWAEMIVKMMQGGIPDNKIEILKSAIEESPTPVTTFYLSYADTMIKKDIDVFRNNVSTIERIFPFLKKKIPYSLLKISKQFLDFGLKNQFCEISSPLKDTFSITNIGDINSLVNFEFPAIKDGSLSLKITPKEALIKPNKSFEFQVDLIFEHPYKLKSPLYVITKDSKYIILLDIESKLSNLKFEINVNEIVPTKKLGHGASGTVWSGNWRGTPVAVKEWHMEFLNSKILQQFQNEVDLISSLRHPNIVLFMGASATYNHVCIVMEILDAGSLYDVLHDNSIKLSLSRKVKMATDAVKGLVYLLGCNVLHRDLKSLNLLVSKNFFVKVADFGLSIALSKPILNSYSAPKGTYQWMAPEVAKSGIFSEKSDVYSFGVILWELLTRNDPFPDIDRFKILSKVLEGYVHPLPPDCPPDWKKLIEDCTALNPDDRPTFTSILMKLQSTTFE